MENTTISFNKIGIVSEILERMNPAIEFLPRDKKTIVISFKRGGFIEFKIPESWEVEAKSYGFLLLGVLLCNIVSLTFYKKIMLKDISML